MRGIKQLLVGLVLVGALVSSLAHATLVDFNNLPITRSTPVPDGYAGLDWNNISAFPTSYLLNPLFGHNALLPFPNQQHELDSAYSGLSSANSAMALGSASISALPGEVFTFNSGYFAAGTRLNSSTREAVEIEAFSGSIMTHSEIIDLNSKTLTPETFNWGNIDRLAITPIGCSVIFFDRLDIAGPTPFSVVPEPSTWISAVGLGLLLLAGGWPRRHA